MAHLAMPSTVPATFRAALRAVAYSRVSTDEQKRGYGIASQDRKNLAYIEKREWNLVGSFPDEGVSGSLEIDDRPEGRKVMQMARRREFDVLVVPKGDRIGRVGRAFWRWVWALEDEGVFVALAVKGIDNTTVEGRAQMRREADFAETEWETIRSRTQDGLQEKAEEGGWTGGPPPFGWFIKFKGEKGESCLSPNPAEGRIAERVIDMLRAGLGWRRAAERLNALGEGWLTRSGVLWSGANLRNKMLSEPMLYGYVTFRKDRPTTKLDRDGNPIYGPSVRIPAPVFLSETDVLFLRSLKKNGAPETRRETAFYPLSARIVGVCGMHFTGRNRPEGRTYLCHGRNEKIPGEKLCSDTAVSADLVEEYVWSRIVDSFSDPDRLRELAGEWATAAGSSPSVHEDRIADLDNQISVQNAAIAAVVASAAKTAAAVPGLDIASAIQAATLPMAVELKQLQEMRDEARSWLEEKNLARERANSLSELAADSGKRLPGLPMAERARFIALLDIRVTLLGNAPARRGGRHCSVSEWFRGRQRAVPVLTDALWDSVQPLLRAPDRRGDTRRAILEAALNKAASGRSWTVCAGEFGVSKGSATNVWLRWVENGTWERLMIALADAEHRPAYVDAAALPALRIEGRADPRLLADTERTHSGSFPQCQQSGFPFELH